MSSTKDNTFTLRERRADEPFTAAEAREHFNRVMRRAPPDLTSFYQAPSRSTLLAYFKTSPVRNVTTDYPTPVLALPNAPEETKETT